MNLKRCLLLGIVGLSGLVACGGSGDEPGSAAPGQDSGSGDRASVTTTVEDQEDQTGSEAAGPISATVDIKEFKFLPPKVEVSVGSAVKWINRDAFKHTVTSGDFSGSVNQPDGKFDENLASADSEAVVTFPQAGTFTYYCRQHNSMNAEVLVR